MNRPQPKPSLRLDGTYRALLVAGAVSALTMVCFMIIQIAVFSAWPPPTDVEGMFSLFQDNWFLGLLSMDLLYIVDSVLLIIIYLAMYRTLQEYAPAAMLVGTVLAIVGVGGYFASNTAFEMFSLARQHALAADMEQKRLYVAAGMGMMATYSGTSFNVYYVLNTIILFIYVFVMRRAGIYGKAIPRYTLAAGLLMIIPSSVGMIGMIFSLASLVPWAIWLVLVARRLLSFVRTGPA
ncbi:MAG: hypothetical protein RBT44_04640 [Sphaerochaetaceae bacterium]|nr:hypothetical protein [Sphaerochaetaceae bacterium]